MARNRFHSSPSPSPSAKDRGHVNDHPPFVNTLQTHFSGTLSLNAYMQRTYERLQPHGFTSENTMGMVAVCRDELTDPVFEAAIDDWGKTFNCCSLAGFVMSSHSWQRSIAAPSNTPSLRASRFTDRLKPSGFTLRI